MEENFLLTTNLLKEKTLLLFPMRKRSGKKLSLPKNIISMASVFSSLMDWLTRNCFRYFKINSDKHNLCGRLFYFCGLTKE